MLTTVDTIKYTGCDIEGKAVNIRKLNRAILTIASTKLVRSWLKFARLQVQYPERIPIGGVQRFTV